MAHNSWLPLILLVGVLNVYASERSVLVATPRAISSGDELVASVIRECVGGDVPAMKCVRVKALEYLDSVVGAPRAARGLTDPQDLDDAIAERVGRIFNEGELKVRLPEVLFQSAVLRIRPGKGIQDLRVTFPSDGSREGKALRQGVFSLVALVKLGQKCTCLPKIMRNFVNIDL